jgi:hypothetical protein
MDPDPKEVPKVELEQLLQVRRTLFPSPQDFFGRRDKSAGVFEAKQKASHAKESLKLLDIEYFSPS